MLIVSFGVFFGMWVCTRVCFLLSFASSADSYLICNIFGKYSCDAYVKVIVATNKTTLEKNTLRALVSLSFFVYVCGIKSVYFHFQVLRTTMIHVYRIHSLINDGMVRGFTKLNWMVVILFFKMKRFWWKWMNRLYEIQYSRFPST